MTKSELLFLVHRRVRKRARISPLLTRAVLEAFLDVIGETVNSGEPVRLRGFGNFDIILAPKKAVYDFKNEEMTSIPPRSKVVFTPSPKRFTIV